MTTKLTIPAILLLLSVFNTLGISADVPKSSAPKAPEPAVKVEQAKPKKTEKLSKIESLALQSLNDRQRVLQEDIAQYSREVCTMHKVPTDDCSIDPQGLTISEMDKPKPEPDAAKK